MNTLRHSTLLLLLLSALHGHAADPIHYRLRGNVTLQECKIDGTILEGKTAEFLAGERFVIQGFGPEDSYVIHFWNVLYNGPSLAAANRTDAASRTKAQQRALSDYARHVRMNIDPAKPVADQARYFRISKAMLAMFAEPLLARTAPVMGIATLPFKLRPQNGDFTKDVSLTGQGGIKLRWGQTGLATSAVFGVGISSVTLDSANTCGRVTTTNDQAAITLSTGLVVQWQRLQFGVFMGWDHLSHGYKKIWIHNSKPWLALGIGLAIFTEENVAVKEGTQ